MTSDAGCTSTDTDVPHHLVHSLVTQHRTALVAYAERLLADRHMAEDIVQEALIRAWRHANRLQEHKGSVRSWLFTVTHNLAVDRVRSAHHRHETVAPDHPDVPEQDRTHAVLTFLEAVSLLRTLPLEQRAVLVHTYLFGRTVKETAIALGIPAGTVKSRQHYALHTLRAQAGVRPTTAIGRGPDTEKVSVPPGVPPATGRGTARTAPA